MENTIFEVFEDTLESGQGKPSAKIFPSHSRTQYIFLLPQSYSGVFEEEKTLEIQDGAEVDLYFFYFGGDEVNIRTHVHVGKRARVNFSTFFFASGSQKCRMEEFFRLEGEESYARFFARTLTGGEAESSYLGDICVTKQGQKTDSRLEIRSLIFGNKAKSHMIPKLEIEANNVKAGHAATLAHIDEDSLFYLRSRGLKKEKANELMIEGIFLESMKNIQDGVCVKRILDMMREKVRLSMNMV